MTPAARLQAAIDILAMLPGTRQPLERLLKDFFRARRYAGSKDRRAIGELVFQVQRHRAALQHRMTSDDPRALAIGALLAQGEDPAPLFSGGYGPAPLTDTEQAAIAAQPSAPPLWVQGEFPAFLESELTRAFGPALLEEMRTFQERAPVDLRVNRLKATRETVLAALVADGIAAAPLAHAPDGIRCPAGALPSAHPLFESGAFEIQDEAAQIAAMLCDAQPAMAVLDLAAGAGGKSLALAAAMENRGRIAACDIRGEALFELERRAVRAGATIITSHVLGEPPPGPFDRVLVDAPCSGSGTWRRQPELKWRLTPQRLAELTALQDSLLDTAAALVGQGGRLIYATCSVLPLENEDRVAAFQARTPDFRPLRADSLVSGLPGLAADYRASPASTGTDGFFGAILERI